MQQYEMVKAAIAEKARSERLFMCYALTLAVILAIGGTALIILGIGDHLDIVIHGDDLEARFINASPGVALWLVSAFVFLISKPRRLEADASHHGAPHRLRFARADMERLDIKFAASDDTPESSEQADAAPDEPLQAQGARGRGQVLFQRDPPPKRSHLDD